MELITKTPRQTYAFGQKIGNDLINYPPGTREAVCICLYGDLGSGKTTLVKGIANSLDITSLVASPTFIIVRHYPIKQKFYSNFYHIDLYRIENSEDIKSLGLFDFFSDSSNIIAIEWAEKLGSNIPRKRLDIKMSLLNDNTRKVVYGKSS